MFKSSIKEVKCELALQKAQEIIYLFVKNHFKLLTELHKKLVLPKLKPSSSRKLYNMLRNQKGI